MREDTLLIVLTFALGAVLAQVSLCALAGTLAGGALAHAGSDTGACCALGGTR